MSSLVRRIQKGKGGFIGLLTSARKCWGAKIGVRNDTAKTRPASRGSRRGKRNKAYVERRKAVSA